MPLPGAGGKARSKLAADKPEGQSTSSPSDGHPKGAADAHSSSHSPGGNDSSTSAMVKNTTAGAADLFSNKSAGGAGGIQMMSPNNTTAAQQLMANQRTTKPETTAAKRAIGKQARGLKNVKLGGGQIGGVDPSDGSGTVPGSEAALATDGAQVIFVLRGWTFFVLSRG